MPDILCILIYCTVGGKTGTAEVWKYLRDEETGEFIYDDEGNRLPATYANFLIVNNGVLVPVYNQPKKDRLACQIIRVAFPGHEIVPVDCRALIQQHGSLHCATMQFPVINF